MLKITDKNRNLVLLASIMVIGILVISIQVLYENNDIIGYEKIDDKSKTNMNDLNTKIDNLLNENFDPTSYSNLLTEIEDSYSQKLIVFAVKTNLQSKLIKNYSTLIYNQCEFYLTSNQSDSKTVLELLNYLEKITSKNAKIEFYKSQIGWYKYYTETLPIKVSNFIAPGITNYNDSKYISLLNEVQNMPGLNDKYKNAQKLNKIRIDLKSNLNNFNADYADAYSF